MQTNTFGRWIKKLRAEQDLTQEQLSELVGCATPTLRSFEIGIRRPSREMAERIAEVLKVPADERNEFLRLARQAIEPRPTDEPQQTIEPPRTERSNPAPVLSTTVQPAHVAPPRSLIGREAEIHALSHLLRDEHQRLVTIVGPGGMGKTRLAQQVAAECGRHFRDGAAFVTLASVADGQNIPTTIADGLGLSLHQAIDVRERLLQLLSEREQLVVLDNFEHLLAPTASTQASAIDFIQKILQRSAGIHLLITSRERLRIQRERTFELAGLSIPKQHQAGQDATRDVEQADAAILFIERAQQIAGHFALTTENRTAIARICTLLDGMPLAIELAASWVRVLSCDEIADEIQRSIDFLVLADRDMTPRHRSMRVVFDQSWSLLSDAERRVLGELSVFRGGCRREAAVAVANANLPILASLIDKSLLRKSQAGSATRYDMHELIRQYAEEQLRSHASDYEAAHKRHADYYLGLVAQRANLISTERMREVMAELNGEIDNLRLAWDWAVANRQAAILHQIGMTIWIFLEVRASYREGEEIFRRASQMAQRLRSDPGADHQFSDLLWAHMTTHQAYFTHRQVRPVESRRLVEPALALLRQLNDPFTLQQALFTHGGSSWFHGDLEDAVADYRAGLVIANQLQMPYLLSFHNVFLGILLCEIGQYEESYQHLSLGIDYARQFGDPRSLSFALSYVNHTALMLGRSEETAILVHEALDVARAAEDWFCLALAFEQMALLKQAADHYDEAHHLLDEAQTLFIQIGDVWSQSRLLTRQGRLALQQGNLTEARQRFGESYRIARNSDLLVHALEALAGMAEWFVAQDKTLAAVTLARLTLEHRASNYATRQQVAQLNAELTARLSASEQSALQARLQTTAFDVLVAETFKL